jgi:hypothetical protein
MKEKGSELMRMEVTERREQSREQSEWAVG